MLNLILIQKIFFISFAVLALGAAGALALRKNDKLANLWGGVAAILGSVLAMISSLSILISGQNFKYSSVSSLPFFPIAFNVDGLAAFFIFVISLIAILASIYGIGYSEHFYKKYNLGNLGFFYNIFIAGMIMVVSASNLFFFLIAWEVMSLSSYFLVVFENKEKDNIKAGALYFIMTHIGTAFIILAFLFLYQGTGYLDFSLIKENIGNISPFLRNIIFVLAFVGFGTKAGIIPFHIWLPSAHPAAPTHVSALMSGVMIKTGIYMFIRIFIDIMPIAPIWWGVLILVAGAISSILGVLYALTESDIKKLLAYSSIENIGIILLGVGSSLIFLSLNMKALAVLSLIAALFHILNHAVFKSLLFMGAGSVITKTHTRNMEEYGGLIKYMPKTALFFLIGSMAISALPPFNGFFSEWLTFQSLFSGIRYADASVQWVFVLAAGSLAFTGGLAAACFVKAFGATFLARPRSEAAKHAKESGRSLIVGMGALAALALLIGIFSGAIVNIISKVPTNLNIFNSGETAILSGVGGASLTDGFASISAPFIFFVILIVLALVFLAVKIITADRKIKISRTWDCGTELGPRMEITATGFSRSIITIFRGILKPTKQTEVDYRDADIRYFPKSNAIMLGMQDIYGKYFYKPIQKLIMKIAETVKLIQVGSVNIYVLYIFLTLIGLLLFLVA